MSLLCMYTTDTVFERRPKEDDVTVREVLSYMLQEEVKATAKRGCYSGVQFTLNVCYNT